MRKLKPGGVEEIAAQPEPFRLGVAARSLGLRRLRGDLVGQLARCAVEAIPNDRMTQRCHVNANLMSAARLDTHMDEREFAEARCESFDYLVMGNGRAGIVGGPRG